MLLFLLAHAMAQSNASIDVWRQRAKDYGDPEAYAQVGLWHAERGEEAKALKLLAAAAKSKLDDALLRRVRVELEALLGDRPGGVDGYLTARGDALLGKPFPVRSFELEGEQVQLDALDGIVVVHIWATWCPPCLAGMPHLDQVEAAYAERGVRTISLSVDKNRNRARAWARKHPVSHSVGWIGDAGYELLPALAPPNYYILDAQGIVRHTWSGWGPEDHRLEASLDALLGRKEHAPPKSP